ncbi:putative thebaine 6-O-demethylase [Helianthus annuus]|nr:putative thebaine 6-O-demethylase [Helianthus annuus]
MISLLSITYVTCYRYKEETSRKPYRLSNKEACEEYVKDLKKLSNKLLELISLSLNLPANRLEPFLKDQTTFVRLNHYSPCPAPDLALGVGRHKDAGALTILAQDDVGGLEVKRKTDRAWIFVKPTPNAFIVNVGDIIQVISIGYLCPVR